MKLSPAQRDVLLAIAGGARLKSHRDIDGHKRFRLHAVEGPPRTLRRATVESLLRRGLLGSNQKFPAATLWLTESGRRLSSEL